VGAPNFVLGVPRCNEPPEIFGETLDAILASSLQPALVAIIDNGDQPLELGGRRMPPNTINRPGRNVGCAGAWNRVCETAFACGKTAIVVNGDCAVAPDTFERMLAEPAGHVVLAHGWECFRLDRQTWELVGRFDEEFYPVYYEDCDYRYRLALASVPVIEWPVVQVSRPSYGRATTTTGITHGWDVSAGYQGWRAEKLAWFNERLEANRSRYVMKWNGMPGFELYRTPFGR